MTWERVHDATNAPRPHSDSWESRLTAATVNHKAATAEWHATIVNARRAGLSVRTIAEHTGVSPQTVLNICNRHWDKP